MKLAIVTTAPFLPPAGHGDGRDQQREGTGQRSGDAGQKEIGADFNVSAVTVIVNDAHFGVFLAERANQGSVARWVVRVETITSFFKIKWGEKVKRWQENVKNRETWKLKNS